MSSQLLRRLGQGSDVSPHIHTQPGQHSETFSPSEKERGEMGKKEGRKERGQGDKPILPARDSDIFIWVVDEAESL